MIPRSNCGKRATNVSIVLRCTVLYTRTQYLNMSYINILNRLGVTHKCDGQTDGQPIATNVAHHHVARLKSLSVCEKY